MDRPWNSVTDKMPKTTDVYEVKTAEGKQKRSLFIIDIRGGMHWSRLGKKDVVAYWRELEE